MVWAARAHEGGFSEDMLSSSDHDGHAVFHELSEGPWDVQILPPGVRKTHEAIKLIADMKTDQTLMLQRDLDRPDVELESIVSTGSPDAVSLDDAKEPVDGEQVQAPLIEEIRGDGE
jgi:hypothetical protein